ncbi:hypothetical protein KI387_015943, partial [Taxus chinensis]
QLVNGANDIEEELVKICAKVLSESSGILPVDDFYKQIQESIQDEPTYGFGLEIIDRFVKIEHSLETLRKLNKRLKKIPSNINDTHETCEVLSDHSTMPDENEMQ